jgi:cellulose synthase/poly-beta-1,6-N-acetylglucosamine synthase-like glycosyltransferase
MPDLSHTLQFVLAGLLCLITILSTQLIALGLTRIFKKRPNIHVPELPDETCPRVLIQLPVCDEGALAVRVAAAAARLDWPKNKLEIQLLEDGKTENHETLSRAVLSVIPEDVNFKILHRGVRTGFKAGNLANGLAHSDAPYVAIFDADFVPPTDYLRRTVPALVADEDLAFVQARWGHANRHKNWLTRAQGILLDSHFAIEQEARFRAGLPISFNGTAGVWRRAAIDHGGGWTGDTLTEDLDLSMRCALKGWQGAIINEVEVPGELPETAAAWRAQQARWTKGHAQCAKKLLPEIWASQTFPLWKKALLSFQICQFAFYLLAATTAVVSLTLIYLGTHNMKFVDRLGMFVTFFGLFGSMFYLYLGQAMLGREREPAILRSILLAMVFPSGLVLANARATFEAFFSTHMTFHRTLRAGEAYLGGWKGYPELLAGLSLPAFAFAEQAWSAPFFVFAVAGLVSIGVMGFSGSTPQPRRDTVRTD